MTPTQYAHFHEIRDEMKRSIDLMLEENGWILDIQRALYRARGYRVEELESPIVYNLALDEIRAESDPRFIIVADNPGLQEQKTKNHRYLVGQSGKLAVSWFRKNLSMDFRTATIIINKTPIHTPKTAELRLLIKLADDRRDKLLAILDQSQRAMARFAIGLAECLQCPLWVSGIGELQTRGIFHTWADELRVDAARSAPEVRANILLFRHFSMNQFAIEYAAAQREQEQIVAGAASATGGASDCVSETGDSAKATIALLEKIGTKNRERILGF